MRREEKKNPSVSFHYAKSDSLSQQMGAGGDLPPPPSSSVALEPTPPPPTLRALRPLCSGHMTHSTIEWDAPSFAYSYEFWKKKKKEEAPGRRTGKL